MTVAFEAENRGTMMPPWQEESIPSNAADAPRDACRRAAVAFAILGEIEDVETIAAGAGVKVRAHLNKIFGRGRWRKRKGFARVRLGNGAVRRVELHW